MLLNNLEYVSKEVNQELNNELTNKNLINPSKIEDHYAILITEKILMM